MEDKKSTSIFLLYGHISQGRIVDFPAFIASKSFHLWNLKWKDLRFNVSEKATKIWKKIIHFYFTFNFLFFMAFSEYINFIYLHTFSQCKVHATTNLPQVCWSFSWGLKNWAICWLVFSSSYNFYLRKECTLFFLKFLKGLDCRRALVQ